MTESKKRKFHPLEFNAKLGLEALGGMKTSIRSRKNMGFIRCKPGNGSGRSKLSSGFCLKANEAPNRVPAEQAPDRLYGEIERLEMEFDWLKKSPGSACHDQLRPE
jgi:transposase